MAAYPPASRAKIRVTARLRLYVSAHRKQAMDWKRYAGSSPAVAAPQPRIVREFCVNQSCTVLHRRAFSATSAPSNRLMQLMFQFSARD